MRRREGETGNGREGKRGRKNGRMRECVLVCVGDSQRKKRKEKKKRA